jgi:hypothetical protein
MAFQAPEIGVWYIDLQLKQQFEVVAFDDSERTIEIQYVDGEVSEIDLEAWRQLPVELAAAPEDWSASYELEREDNPFDETASQVGDPLATIESDLFEGSDPY